MSVVEARRSMTQEDRTQVASILRTHAHMQDQASLDASEVMTRLQRDFKGDSEERDMIEELGESIEQLEDDRDNLNRIASDVEFGGVDL